MDLSMTSFACNLGNVDSCINVSSSTIGSAESIDSDVCPVCNTKKETLAKREELAWQREAILHTREKELREYELLLGEKKCVLNEREKKLQAFIDSGAVVSSEVSSAKHSRRSSVSIPDFDTLNRLQGESDAKNNELLDKKERQIFEKENLIDIKTKNLQVREENILIKELLLNEQKALFKKEEELAKERYNDLKMREKIIIKMEEAFHATFEAIKENKRSLEDDYRLLNEKENILSVAEEIIASREAALKEREEKVDKVLDLLKQADISMKTISTNDKLNKYSDFFQNINELFNLKWVSIEQRENVLKQNELILEEKWTNYYETKGLLKAEDEEQRNNKGHGENSRLFTERLEKESNIKASPDLDVILPQEGQCTDNQQVSLGPTFGSNTNEKECEKTINFQKSLENVIKNKVHDSEITGSTRVFENRMCSDAITNCDSMKLHLGAKICSNQSPELSENKEDKLQGENSRSCTERLEKESNIKASPDLDVILPQEGQCTDNQQVSLGPTCGSNTNEKEGAKTNNFQMESLENVMKNKVRDSEITGSTRVFENRMSSDAITNCDSMKLHLGAKVCSNQSPELSENKEDKLQGENSRSCTERLEKESNIKASPDLDVILPQEGQCTDNQQVSLGPTCGSNTNEKEGAKTNNFQMESLENVMKNKVRDSEITGSTRVFENRMSSDAITNCDSMKLHLGAKVCSNQPPELSENRENKVQGNVSMKFVSLQEFLEKTKNVPAINNMSQKSDYVVNSVSSLQRTIDKMQKRPEQEALEPGRLKQQCLAQQTSEQERQELEGLEQKRTTLKEVVQESQKPEGRVPGSSVCEGRLAENLLRESQVPEGRLSESRAQYSGKQKRQELKHKGPDKEGCKFQEQKRQDRVSYRQEGRVQRGKKSKEFFQERLGNGHQKYRQPRNQNQVNPQVWDITSRNCVKKPLCTKINHSLKKHSNSGFKVIGNKIDGGGDKEISQSSSASSPGYTQVPVSKAISLWQNETFANDALLQAISNEKYLETAQLLEHNKVRVLLRARNDLGQSPFLLAVKKRNIELVERLIRMDVNKRECDYNGCSALHLAVINNDINMVHFLLREGLNLCVTDNDGLTAAQLAQKLNFPHLALFLVQWQMTKKFDM